jgi:hypothetical protein
MNTEAEEATALKAVEVMRDVYRVLVENPGGKTAFGRPKCRCEDLKRNMVRLCTMREGVVADS